MIELFLIILCIMFYGGIVLAFVMYVAIGVYYVLIFTLPLIFRFIIFALFNLSVIIPGNRKSFDGTYRVTYFKWNDKQGNVYSTEDKNVKAEKMYYAFSGEDVYSDFQIDIVGVGTLSESGIVNTLENAHCSCGVKWWFFIHADGVAQYPDGIDLKFEIRMMKISNRVIKKFFRCLSE